MCRHVLLGQTGLRPPEMTTSGTESIEEETGSSKQHAQTWPSVLNLYIILHHLDHRAEEVLREEQPVERLHAGRLREPKWSGLCADLQIFRYSWLV